MSSKILPKRSELPVDLTWRLEDIYETHEQWEAEFKQVEESLPELASYAGKVGASAANLLAVLKLSGRVGLLLERLGGYASNRRNEDTTSATWGAMFDRLQSLGVKVGGASAYIQPEMIAIAPERLANYRAEEPALAEYAHYLDSLQRRRPHVRSAEVEQLLAQMGEISAAPSSIFSMINDADMKFPTIVGEDGQEIEVTKGRYALFMESKDRRVRKDAYEAMIGSYQKQQHTLAATLSAQVKRDIFFAQARNHGSALEGALFGNNIPPAVYHNLIGTVEKRLELLHRYMRLRKRVLGLDQVEAYDGMVPLVAEAQRTVTYDEAKATILAALAPLGSEYVAGLTTALSERWVDVVENQGKRSGAYSTLGVYGVHPYILMNWQDNLRNMFTLAHELGHSMHTHFTFKHQPQQYAHYSIFVAEVASTFNESLLHHYLMQRTDDKQLKAYLLNSHLDDLKGTLFNQTQFAHFEWSIHEHVEQGQALTVEWLCEQWKELLVAYSGPEYNPTPGTEYGWSRIPHFYYNYYVYQYATGISAAIALSRQVLSEGAPAVDRYLGYLSSGSSAYPIDVLKRAGVDMTSPAPVEQALQEFEDTLTQLELLLA